MANGCNGTWSELYYTGLTEAEHAANNAWFKAALYSLKDTGILCVPNIGKTFNKQGEESVRNVFKD